MDKDKFIYYKTSSPAGDLISFLSGIKRMYEITGKKGVIYQRLGMEGASYEGAMHPFMNERSHPVCMNEYMFCMLRPLLIQQEYIEDFIIYEGQEANFDLDLIRLERYTNQPKGSLNRWFNYVFPQMASDLSKSWLNVPEYEKTKDKIIINFTFRHRNPIIQYHWLKEYQGEIIFAGLQNEYEVFCDTWKLGIERLVVKDFMELASAIKSCKLFLGNQSFCFQLAEALKAPRILEIFPLLPNVIPVGDNAYDFYAQHAVEYYFKTMLQ
mgnify:CR=1 FL=1